MKTKLVYLIIAAMAGGLLGFAIEKLLASNRSSQLVSVAGQTLTELSLALEIAKQRSGAYPDSISDLQFSSNSGDFSQAMLQRVIYRKTTNGYVAFVGSPRVAYIEPGESAQFE